MTDQMYNVAIDADMYNRQLNTTINNYVKTIFTLTGDRIEDFTASNSKIASDFFHRLNTQRCTYSLGNGISFNEEGIKEYFNSKFDKTIYNIAYKALIHGVCFGFLNVDKLYEFSITEFVPLWDEEDGSLRAGIRFWRLAHDKPMIAVLYEEDGYTKYKSESKGAMDFSIAEEKKPYKLKVAYNDVGDEAVIGIENYKSLPIIPMWGSDLKQSTLIGMKESIDSYDLIRSGFANDMTDCAQIYWILENCAGMDDKDLARFRDRLKVTHIASVDTDDGAKATPYTQEIPYNARLEYLNSIRKGIYEDFGALDVHELSAGSTNDHIEASYQPLDENADDFEYNVIEFIEQLLQLIGKEGTPIFKRNRISNLKEQTEMVLSASSFLDRETVIKKLPFITVDEVDSILDNLERDEYNRFSSIGDDVDVIEE